MPTPLVRVLGLSLAGFSLAGEGACHHNTGDTPTHNPPAPDPVPIVGNPPAPVAALPSWDAVKSSHPPGATNPPYPVLVVARDAGTCFKAWRGGMMAPPADVQQAGGQVVATAAEVPDGIQVVCPEGQPGKLLAAWDALPASSHEPPRR